MPVLTLMVSGRVFGKISADPLVETVAERAG